LYSATEEASSCSLHLEGCLGITRNHHAIPADLDLYDAKDGLAPAFRQAVAKKRPIVIEQIDGSCRISSPILNGEGMVILQLMYLSRLSSPLVFCQALL
jgi:hypothetical protein